MTTEKVGSWRFGDGPNTQAVGGDDSVVEDIFDIGLGGEFAQGGRSSAAPALFGAAQQAGTVGVSHGGDSEVVCRWRSRAPQRKRCGFQRHPE